MFIDITTINEIFNCQSCQLCKSHVNLMKKFQANDLIKLNDTTTNQFIQKNNSLKEKDTFNHDLKDKEYDLIILEKNDLLIETNTIKESLEIFKCEHCERKFSSLKSCNIHSKNCDKNPSKKQRPKFKISTQRKLYENTIETNVTLTDSIKNNNWKEESKKLQEMVKKEKNLNKKTTNEPYDINHIDKCIKTKFNKSKKIIKDKVKSTKFEKEIDKNMNVCKICSNIFENKNDFNIHKNICSEDDFLFKKSKNFNSFKQRITSQTQLYLYRLNLYENEKYNQIENTWKNKSLLFRKAISYLKKLSHLGLSVKNEQCKVIEDQNQCKGKEIQKKI